jgi:hypothetical protein
MTSRIVLLFERKYSTVRASLIPCCQIESSEGWFGLDQIAEMENQRQKAIESLEIISDKVRCQGCNSLQPIRPALTNSKQHSSRIYELEIRIKQIERHHIGGGTSAKKEREELKLLLEEHDKKDELIACLKAVHLLMVIKELD